MLYEQKGGVGSDVRQGMGGPCRQMFSRLWPTSTIADSPTSFGQIQPWNPPCKIHTTSLFPHPQLSPTIVEWLSIEVGDRVSAKVSNPSPPPPPLNLMINTSCHRGWLVIERLEKKADQGRKGREVLKADACSQSPTTTTAISIPFLFTLWLLVLCVLDNI